MRLHSHTSQLSFVVLHTFLEYVNGGQDRPPSGSTISDVVPSGTFRCSDGRYVVIGGNGDSVYSRLMQAIGRPDMTSENDKYADNARRCAEVDAIMGEKTATI